MSVDSEVSRRPGAAHAARRATARRTTNPAPPTPMPLVVAGALGGLAAAALSMVIVGVPVLVGWMLVPDSAQSLSQMLQVTGGAWLAGQGMPVVIGDVTVSLLPFGIGLLCVLMIALAARWSTRASAVARPGEALAVAGSASAAYGVVAALTAVLSRLVAVPPARALVTTALLAFVVTALVALAATGQRSRISERMPIALRDCLAAAVASMAALVGLAAAALGISLIIHAPEIGALMSALHLDAGGAIMITALSLAYLPVAVVWSLSYLLGPGIAFGGAHVLSPWATAPPTTLPGFPLLAALPSSLPAIAMALPALLLVGGVLSGLILRRRGYTGTAGLGMSIGAGAMVGLAVAVLVLLSSGALGSEQLARVGPSVFATAGMAALVVAVGSVAAAVWPPSNRDSELTEPSDV